MTKGASAELSLRFQLLRAASTNWPQYRVPVYGNMCSGGNNRQGEPLGAHFPNLLLPPKTNPHFPNNLSYITLFASTTPSFSFGHHSLHFYISFTLPINLVNLLMIFVLFGFTLQSHPCTFSLPYFCSRSYLPEIQDNC